MKRPYGTAGTQQSGAALIITLAFMILLAGLLIIFFTQSLSYRQQSNGNFNDLKSATLAQSALETVVGDLRQEIANGSSSSTYGSGTTTSYLFQPTNNLFAVPQRSGTNYVSGVDTTPNLVRISVRSDTIAYPGVASRASAVSSTNAAFSGQYVSMPRWNKHYLLPRASAGSSSIDTTPTNTFNPPDWVFVSSSGPTVLTTPTASVIGRYAYAIYDEGGLLDANVAGTPSNTPINTAPDPVSGTTWPVWGSGLKGSEAFADLTVTNAATQAPILTQTQIDQIVGWRNNATAKPSGNYASGYTFTSANAAAYHDYVVNNTNGFLVTSGHSYTDSASGKTDTDQAFTSRQSLIKFVTTAGLPQDALQYLATFTRDTEQPSYSPPVGRPMVQSSATVNAASFGTGNDAYHVDRITTAPTTNAPSDINPPFLNVRVTVSFTRADGTIANIGDPLIKERFPLSRLTNFPTGEAAPIGSASNPATQAGRIYNYFGLTYVAASETTPAYWSYNHDTGNLTGIDRLAVGPNNTTAVTMQGREPDFFELLKAAINVGSIGKGSAYNQDNSGVASPNTGQATYTTTGSVGYIAQARDTLTNLQILQIGANIIDQSKGDNFPTRILFSGDANLNDTVSGSEDLPYLYRIRNWLDQISTTQVIYMIQPELWDPYAYGGTSFNSSAATTAATAGQGSSGFVTATNTPKIFRVRLEPDPTAVSVPVNMSVDYQYLIPKSGGGTTVEDDWQAPNTTFSLNATNFQNSTQTTAGSTSAKPNPVPLSFEAGEQNGFWGFREPTLLAVPALNASIPINLNSIASTASGTAAPLYTDLNTTVKMTGFLMSNPFPTTIPATNPLSTTSYETLAKINLEPNYTTPTMNTVQPPCLRMYLDYQDPNNSANWINYDQQTFSYQNGAASYDAEPSHFANQKTYAAMLGYFDWFYWNKTDPRTQRWATAYSQYAVNLTTFSAANNEFGSQRPDGGLALGNHLGSRSDAGFHLYGNYGNQYRGYETEYVAENNTLQTYQTDSGDNNQRFMTDPDGVPRRAMAGYVSDPADNGSVPSNNNPEGSLGLPLYRADNITSGVGGQGWSSRPTMLHRPFRSVAELGYVFRDTPWANLNFSAPESGDSALLDIFCINDSGTSPTPGLLAGRVNLNTRQAPVIAAMLSGALTDKDNSAAPTLSQAMASDIASALVARTTTLSTQGPLTSRADLIGVWTGSAVPATSGTSLKTADTSSGTTPAAINANNFYTGFSADIGARPSVTGTSVGIINRQRESAIRALVDSGTTRTWNLLIDLVAQSGRFPPPAVAAGTAGMQQFVVEGEKHYWLHVAIDRYTGKVIDSQLEVVRE